MKTETLDIRNMDPKPYIVPINHKRKRLGYKVWNPNGKNGQLCATKKDAWKQFNKQEDANK